MAQEPTPDASLDRPLPLWAVITMPVWTGGSLALPLFLTAGDWRWLAGWAFVLSFALTATIAIAIINRRAPRVLRNRMKTKKEGLTAATEASAGSDRFLMPVISVGFLGALIVPGLGHRLGWPPVPLVLEIAALVLTNTGTVLVFAVMLQNAYASKLLDINRDQVLIDSGFYAHVRHPMYSGYALMILTVPLALGSWWGLIPAAVAVLGLVVRIRFEEQMLLQGMDGYEAYRTRVRYRLIPGIY